MFCRKCGKMSNEKICPYCGEDNCSDVKSNVYISDNNETDIFRLDNEYNYYTGQDILNTKSRFKAGILQLFLGSLGIGRFYLGYTGIGIMQICASILTCGLGGTIWGFIDGVLILNGNIQKDAKNIPLSD